MKEHLRFIESAHLQNVYYCLKDQLMKDQYPGQKFFDQTFKESTLMKEHLRFIESAHLQKCLLLFPTFVVQFYTNSDNETSQTLYMTKNQKTI